MKKYEFVICDDVIEFKKGNDETRRLLKEWLSKQNPKIIVGRVTGRNIYRELMSGGRREIQVHTDEDL